MSNAVKVKRGKKAEVEREPLFTIVEADGTETVYTIMKTVPARIALRYLRDLNALGGERATALVLAEILGDDTYNAIADSEEIDDETAKRLFRIAQEKLLGALEVLQGNSPSA